MQQQSSKKTPSQINLRGLDLDKRLFEVVRCYAWYHKVPFYKMVTTLCKEALEARIEREGLLEKISLARQAILK